MKFLKSNPDKHQDTFLTTNNMAVENFIEDTKIALDKHLKNTPSAVKRKNISENNRKALKSLTSPPITIKPADKNLGIVILNSKDYVTQCLSHLSSNTYVRVTDFPANSIKKNIENVLIKFKDQLSHHRCLYQYLQPTQEHMTPEFYGLPKIHKPPNEDGIPPIRPIISHTDSLLSRTARFIDHVLQPLAQSYSDYTKNSTQLISTLENLTIREDITLVTMDVTSLYPSIPQQECLEIIHNEMCKFPDLIIHDPNIITHLLQVNMSSNFFTFADITFLQTDGTAMGAAFSPTIANIYMSVFLRNFLSRTSEKPILIKRYIDDIFMIWHKRHDLSKFLDSINRHHPKIHFTSVQSDTSVNFLDITIRKSKHFEVTGKLNVSTFQKENNLYQYLHFSSNHPRSVFKGLIVGEAIRYVRTNSSEYNYRTQVQKFSNRLLERSYPTKVIKNALSKVNYNKRAQYIQQSTKPASPPMTRPVFKCIPPPHYLQLKEII